MTPAPNASVAPFEFASDFSASAHQVKKSADSARQLAERLSECETAAYSRGYADGVSAETAGANARLASVMEAIGARLEAMDADIAGQAARAQGAATELAFAFARKLAGRLIRNDPVAPVIDGFASLLTDLVGQSDVTICVAPASANEVGERLQALAKGRLANCTLHVTADDAIAPGDCRIDWANGGLVRDQAMLEARLKELVDRTIGGGVMPDNPPEETP